MTGDFLNIITVAPCIPVPPRYRYGALVVYGNGARSRDSMYDADGAWSSGRSAASTVIPNPTLATPYPDKSAPTITRDPKRGPVNEQNPTVESAKGGV